MRGLSGTGLGRGALFTFGVITLLAIGTFALAGGEMLKRVDAQPAKSAIQPSGAQEATPEAVAQTADKTEPKSKADQVERAAKEPDPVPDKASDSASASGSAPASASPPCRHDDVSECSRYGCLRHSRGRGNFGGKPLAGGRAPSWHWLPMGSWL